MSTEPARGPMTRVRNAESRSAEPAPADAAAHEATEFVRFCYRRRRVSWPSLYDEMCAVAARGDYRGLGYAELAERGISFCLTDLPRLAALTEIVIADERGRPDGTTDQQLRHLSVSAARAAG